MTIKKLYLLLPLICAAFTAAFAQQVDRPVAVPDSILVAPQGYILVDSVIYTPIERYNKTLAQEGLLAALPSNLSIRQSDAITNAALRQIEANRNVQVDGYRIRIFFDNRQDAREASLKAEQQFQRLFPGYPTYRTFQNPFFKVTIGDFRSNLDAQIALRQISKSFPTAFIIKEKMKYPIISEKVRASVDTVRFMVPAEVPQTLPNQSEE